MYCQVRSRRHCLVIATTLIPRPNGLGAGAGGGVEEERAGRDVSVCVRESVCL